MAENFFGLTDVGRQRDNNEDAFIAQSILNKQFIMACVIDGVGGYEGGEVAAAIAKEAFLNSFFFFKKGSADMIGMLRQSFLAANEKIYNEKIQSGKNSSMACVATLAIVDIKNNILYYAHVGDTRLYLLRDHSLIKVTKDQSFVGFLEDSGRLSEEEAMTHPKRNEIDKALGFNGQVMLSNDYFETGESPFLPGDLILLCSDGLTDLVTIREMTGILEKRLSLEQKAKELVAAANNAGGKDNITVVLVQNNKKPARPEMKRPVLIKKMDQQSPMPQASVSPPETVPAPVPARLSEKTGTNNHTGLIILLSALCLDVVEGNF